MREGKELPKSHKIDDNHAHALKHYHSYIRIFWDAHTERYQPQMPIPYSAILNVLRYNNIYEKEEVEIHATIIRSLDTVYLESLAEAERQRIHSAKTAADARRQRKPKNL